MFLQITNLSKTYRDGSLQVEVLKSISFSVAAGSMFGITGASGAGKTTLLNIIGTLDRPDAGTVSIDGSEVSAWPEDNRLADFRASHIGFLFQFHHLLPDFTALENVMLPGWINHRDPGDLQERARELLAAVGLAERENHRPNQLSGGERQRVAMARALINQPRLVLADEPTGNLDSANALKLLELMRHFNREHGQTFIIVTHNPDLEALFDGAVHLKDGLAAQS
jgi:lipoprotein-releasing system ATP-binding protein